jgi:hypothetical protein
MAPMCTQRTISVPGEVDYKSRQGHYWGRQDWIISFSRRSRVEGRFGNLKDRSHEHSAVAASESWGCARTHAGDLRPQPRTCGCSTPGPLAPDWTSRHRSLI